MHKSKTLDEIAHHVMLEKGFLPDFSKDVLLQSESINKPANPVAAKDLRQLLWVSIDNEDSKDLDQLTYAEAGKIYIAVADVDALIAKETPIDEHAKHNTTSVYTPTKVFPMLPLKFSTNLTSLNEHSDRCAIVVEVSVAEDGKFDLSNVYPALVNNKAKLNYPGVGALLEHMIGKHPLPSIPHLREQLFLQDRIAEKIQNYRNSQGALEFGTIQLHAVIVDGIPVDLKEEGRNRAHKLIENFMIAANVAATRFLKKNPTIRRVVRKPKNWLRIVALAKDLGTTLPHEPDAKALRKFLLQQQARSPLHFPDLSLSIIKLLGRGEYVLAMPGQPSPGHFDLAEHEYTHATAPNRRFPDLIMQRLLKAELFDTPAPYSPKDLAALATHCTQKEDDADRLERRLLKCAAAIVLQKDVGKTFSAMVTGASSKGTWVRVTSPPIEGKLVKGFEGREVGHFLKVKLLRVDITNGHIDFAAQ